MSYRNLFKTICLLLFVSIAVAICHATTPVEKHGRLKVTGTQLVDEQDEPVVLRGVSLGWHNWWPRFYNAQAVETFASGWKCSVVRAAIGVGPKNSYLQNPQWAMECLTQVVDAAIANGIYVVVDFHSHQIYREEAKAFFTQIAGKYKDCPNIIYEIFNEPLNTHTWKEVKAYSEELINTIRELSPENIILVGSPSWNLDLHLVAEDPIQAQSNIMYSMHFYAATHKKWLRDRGDEVLLKGIPLFVSECAGMEATGDGAINHAEWQEYVDWMEQRSISWVCWSVADKNETCSMLTPTASSTGPWTADDIKEWGKTVKETIMSNWTVNNGQ